MKMIHQPAITAILAAAAFCLAVAPASAAGEFESPPSLTNAGLLPASLISGPHHTLVEPVALERFQGAFDIQSRYGKLHAAGVELLSLRVAEFPAIEALSRINKGEAFTDALAKAAKAPLDFVGNLLTNPGGTLGNVATGVGQMVDKAGNIVRSGVDSIADSASDILDGAGTSAAASEEPPPHAFLSDPFGYNKARRQWAKTLNVDPYTSNPVLRQLLDDATSATFAGSFAVDTTLGVVAAPVKFAVGFDSDSRDAMWDLSPGDIEIRNEARLKAMGIEGRSVRDFFRNAWFTPTLQTGLVGTLEKLDTVRGRASIIAAAAGTRGENRVRGLIGVLNLLADHHRQVAPLDEIRLAGPLALATRQDGERVVAMNADYLYWTPAAAEIVAHPDLRAPRRTFIVSGMVSVRTRQEMERAGWVLLDAGSPRPDRVQRLTQAGNR